MNPIGVSFDMIFCQHFNTEAAMRFIPPNLQTEYLSICNEYIHYRSELYHLVFQITVDLYNAGYLSVDEMVSKIESNVTDKNKNQLTIAILFLKGDLIDYSILIDFMRTHEQYLEFAEKFKNYETV